MSGLSELIGYGYGGGGAYGQQSNMSYGPWAHTGNTTLPTATITVSPGRRTLAETKVASPPSLDSDGVLAYLRARKAEWLAGVKVK